MTVVNLEKNRVDNSEKPNSLIYKIRMNKNAYMFMAPYLAIFFIFTVVPVIASIIISLTNFNMLQFPDFIGHKNYSKLFLADDIFLLAIKNTMIFALVTGPLGYLLSFTFAWLINEMSRRIRMILTLLFYAPTISGNVFMIWAVMFSGDSYGYINGFLLSTGIIIEPIQWFTDVRYMVPLLIIVALWMSLGAGFLAFIAGLQTVDRTLYESGAIDGIKNRWEEVYFITLPSMRPQLMFGAVMSITASFGIGSLITGLSGFPSTDYAAHTIVHHLEDYGGIRFEMGYASAIATILFIIMVFSNKIVQKLIKRVGN